MPAINSNQINGIDINGGNTVFSTQYSDISVSFSDVFTGELLPTISSIEVTNPGTNIESDQLFEIENTQGVGGKFVIKYTNNGEIISTNMINFGYNYFNEFTQIIPSNGGTDGEIKFVIGKIRKYPGYYTASDSLISDDSYIQDGYYYQNYSYVIEVDELFDTYKNLVKKILHPVGYKLFGAISKLDLQDLYAVGELLPLQIDQYPYDVLFLYDQYTFILYQTFTDNFTLNDTIKYTYTKNIDEQNLTIVDSQFVRRVLGLSDSNISFTESLVKETTLAKSETNLSILDSAYVPNQARLAQLNLSFYDVVQPIGAKESDMYGTNFNMDYFAEDYMEEPLGIIISP